MKAVHELPEDYTECASVDLQKNKKLAVFVNLIAAGIGILMVVLACFMIPITTLFQEGSNIGALVIKLVVLSLSTLLYMVLHELVHGIAMRICGTKKVKYGFTGMYAFAGSDDYYDKKAYIFIALAPVVLWGIVIAVINLFVPRDWFWIVYILQVTNVSGAAGDYFVTIKFLSLPKHILVRDCGTSMKVYAKQESKSPILP